MRERGERERYSVPKSRIYDCFELSKLSDKNELELGLGRNQVFWYYFADILTYVKFSCFVDKNERLCVLF